MTELPYAAPWQTGFERYATQSRILEPDNPGAITSTVTIPDGQFWRIIAYQLRVDTNATAGTRTLSLNIDPPGPVQPYVFGNPGTVGPSAGLIATWSANASAFGQVFNAGVNYGTAPIPDVVWQFGTQIVGAIENAVAGDSLANNQGALLFELYTESRAGLLVPSASPIVLV